MSWFENAPSYTDLYRMVAYRYLYYLKLTLHVNWMAVVS